MLHSQIDIPALDAIDFATERSAATQLAVIVPVMNEHDNVHEMVLRLGAALAGLNWEVIFVDDASTDGTPELIEDIARSDTRVRMLRRFGRRGLSSAVVEGIMSTIAPVVAVIDGDLQHDETILPALYRDVAEHGYDLAVGTRYDKGGSTGDWSKTRVAMSRFATQFANRIAKARISDPMSGLFAVDRQRFLAALPQLSTTGYKILLDIMASSPTPLRVAETPYSFRARKAGESKIDTAVISQYAELLWEKAFGHLIPVRLVKFCCVGALGLAVHMGVLAALVGTAGFGTAQSAAVITAILFNFLLNNNFTYRDRRLTGWKLIRGLVSFYLICSIGAAANVGAGIAMVGNDADWWLAGVTGAAVGSLWNFVMASAFTWTKK